MAKQFMKDNVVPILTMIIVVVGLVTTTISIGEDKGVMKTKVDQLQETDKKILTSIEDLDDRQTGSETQQAFMKGVVSTQLNSIQTTVTKMGAQVDGLMRTPNPVPVPIQ